MSVVDPEGLSPAAEAATNRRRFVRTMVGGSMLGSGFAAAVLPVGAETLSTGAEGLLAGRVRIPVGGFELPAYRAAPQGGTARGSGPLPVVLVVSEIFGVHAHIEDVARRLAHQGYLAIAPELFVRQGDAAAYAEIPRLIAEVVSKVPDAQVMTDLDAVVEWAGTQGGDLSRLGITGFCWGGRITWLYAAHAPRLKAGVAWYGRLLGPTSELTPQHPVDLVARLQAPVLGLYGGRDTGIPLDSVDKMKAALAAGSAAAQASEFVVYPDAGHAFHADYRPTYLKAAAEDGWSRCLAWFRSHGVA